MMKLFFCYYAMVLFTRTGLKEVAMNKLLRINLILLATLQLTGCMPSFPREGVPATGTYSLSTDMRYQFSRRGFLLHIPPDYRADRPLPLVLVLHGAFSTGKQTERETGFSNLADKENFLVAYPEGIGLFGFLQHWNAGHCCGRAAAQGVDDVDFIARVIATIGEHLAVDQRKVYLAGMSNGGMLAYRFAAERTDLLTAVAIVSGAMGSTLESQTPWQLPPPQGPLPILTMHGLADDHISWSGGVPSAKAGGRSFLPGPAAVDFWRRQNHCAGEPVEVEAIPGSVQRLVWEDCQGESAVEVDLLQGWGHRWPGRYFTGRLPESDPLHDFDGTARIWEFFRRF